MKLKSETILFSGKDEENKDPSNTSCIIQLHSSPFDASSFRFYLLAISCPWSCAARSHGQMGKDDIQPSEMIALSLIFFVFWSSCPHLCEHIVHPILTLQKEADLFQQPISQLSSKLCVFLTWSLTVPLHNLCQSQHPATLTLSYLPSENLTSTSQFAWVLSFKDLVLSSAGFSIPRCSLLKVFNPVK